VRGSQITWKNSKPPRIGGAEPGFLEKSGISWFVESLLYSPPMEPDAKGPAGVAFGRFLVLPLRRELLADGQATGLGARAFDVLMALIEARGAVVSKEALAARVWPGQIIQDTALQSQVSALRAALGADRDLIRTVSGRGYQFVGEIHGEPARGSDADARAAMLSPQAGSPPTNLPGLVSGLIGRDTELGEIEDLAASHRLVTLTGTGGIGKTRLAMEAARHLMPQFCDGVWIVDFSTLSDASLIPAAIAITVGLDPSGTALRQLVARTLAARSLLLVLDTCEHVVGAVAAMAEELLRTGPAVHIIATSRAPLRAEGEWIYPVLPLAVPAKDAPDDDPLRYGAVRLFIERARAVEPHFTTRPQDLAAIAAICRRVDGIPLAIELAAARAALLSVNQLADELQDSFQLLTGGRRTALPRHQTLRATFDWSHELLPEPERVVFRRLGVFSGTFSLEAAVALAAGPDMAPGQVMEILSELIAKSLVAIELRPIARYHLLGTARIYAREKLAESGERDQMARRHAEYYRDLFERAEAEHETKPTAGWLAEYGQKLDNLRAALDWGFSPGGDPLIAASLTAAAVPLWMQLSLVEELRRRVEQSLNAVAAGAEPDARRDMKLHAALGASLIYTGGLGPEVPVIWNKTLEIAESLDDAKYQMMSLWGLWAYHGNGIHYDTALTLAHRFAALAAARPDPGDRLVGERMIAISYHFLGNQSSARHHIERALPASGAPARRQHMPRLELEPGVTARVHLARILWLQGLPDRAMRAAEQSIEDARAAQHALSFNYALHRGACPVALWTGNRSVAHHYADMLLDHAARHGLGRWQLYGRGYQGALAIKTGDATAGLGVLRACFEELGEMGIAVPRFMRFAAVYMAEALGHAGQASRGLVVIEEAERRAGRTQERWELPELLRVRGELLLMQDAPGAGAVAEALFQQALDLGYRQGALSWELRAAASLARLLGDQGHSRAARELLRPVYGRFTEGFVTADLQSAKALLDALD
jgi:predicted ATPase/DNA-binding winged helix-turn-helix (wHTH) protein